MYKNYFVMFVFLGGVTMFDTIKQRFIFFRYKLCLWFKVSRYHKQVCKYIQSFIHSIIHTFGYRMMPLHKKSYLMKIILNRV